MPQWRMPKKKRHDPATLPRNVMKAANIQSLQEHWKCAKKTADCLGTYCFINNEGTHLPLSHEHLDFWAAAMVHYLFFFCFYWYIYYTAFWRYSRIAPKSFSLWCEFHKIIPCLAMLMWCTKPGSCTSCCSNFQLHYHQGSNWHSSWQSRCECWGPCSTVPTCSPSCHSCFSCCCSHSPCCQPSIWCPISEHPSSWHSLSWLLAWPWHNHCQVLHSLWTWRWDTPEVHHSQAHRYEHAWVLHFVTLDDGTKMELCLGEIAELHDAIEWLSVPK